MWLRIKQSRILDFSINLMSASSISFISLPRRILSLPSTQKVALWSAIHSPSLPPFFFLAFEKLFGRFKEMKNHVPYSRCDVPIWWSHDFNILEFMIWWKYVVFAYVYKWHNIHIKGFLCKELLCTRKNKCCLLF